MKLTYSTLACPNWNLDQIIETAVKNNIDGIDFRGLGNELDITRLAQFTSDLPKTMDIFRSNRLSMPCFNTGISLLAQTSEQWISFTEECRRYVNLASQTQTPYLRIFGGKITPGTTREAARTLAVQRLGQLVEICRPAHIIPLLETHDDWLTGAQLLSIVGAFDENEAGVLWDFENSFHYGESPAETTASLGRRIRHTHIKDANFQQEKRTIKLLGQGEVPLPAIFSALRAMDYTGYYCLESEKRWDATAAEPEIAIPQFARYMQTAQIA